MSGADTTAGAIAAMRRGTDMKNGVIAVPVTRGVAGPSGVITAASASVADGRRQAASIRGSVPLIARNGMENGR